MTKPRRFLFGSAWYPEMWDQERQLRDLDAMAEAGLNHIRVAEFAWSFLEPAPGHFDFAWLDWAITQAHARGLATILCTPTEAPPPWLLRLHPDIQPIGPEGLRRENGGRRGVNLHHPAFLEASDRITQAMATAFGPRVEVAGWQLDNEPGCHDSVREYSTFAEAAFRRWLQQRYGDLATLNRAWHTSFWAHVLNDWEEVVIFRNSRTGVSPQYHLDLMRFGSWSWKTFLDRQATLIRPHARPGQWLTTNWTWLQEELDWSALAEQHDFTSLDVYQREPVKLTVAADLAFSVKRAPHVIMEMPAGLKLGLGEVQTLAGQGALRFLFWKHAINQARGLSTWRWDRCPGGQEMDLGAVVHWTGRRYRAWADYERFGRELGPLEETVLANRKRTRVALLHDTDSFLLDVRRPWDRQRTFQRFFELAGAFHRRGENVAFTRWDQSWDDFSLMIASEQTMITAANAERLRTWVANGGTFIALPGFGTLDQHGLGHTTEEAPAFLTDVFGARWDEQDETPTDHAEHVRLQWSDHPRVEMDATGPMQFIALAENGATAAGRLQSGWLNGETVVSHHAFARGHAVLWGLPIAPKPLDAAILQWASLAGFRVGDLTGLADPGPLSEGVEIIPGTHFTAFLNPGRDRAVHLRLAEPATDLLTGTTSREFDVPPLGVVLAATERRD